MERTHSNTNTQLAEQCAEMAVVLGLDEPVSIEVLQAAVNHPTYANNLLTVREHPEYMQYLLANPPASTSRTTVELIRSAASSLARWARTGFSVVSDETFEHRLSVCRECPNLIRPPADKNMLYEFAGSRGDNRSVCGQCGCVVRIKARRSSDTCPEPDPDNPKLTRWGDSRPNIK